MAGGTSTGGRDAIVVAGAVAQRPGVGGHAWVFLQYLLGFRRLGFDVLFVDRAEGADERWLERTLGRFGIPYVVLGADGRGRAEAVARARESLFLLNVMGFVDDEEVLAAAARRVFLDIDPGFPQMWRELGLADLLSGYDAYVTVGANVGRGDCAIPTCGLDWVTTAQPVVLDEWRVASNGSRAFTGVATWRGPFAPIEYDGRRYGLRVHEFRRFATLPRLRAAEFELALDIDAAETNDLALLSANGWRLADPRAVAGDVDAYRSYVRRSGAEFTVAKGIYVDTRSGWFSDRSICYLASGKPVVAQDTAFPYPRGEGLLAFATVDDASAAVDEVLRDYARHARAARELAEEYFDSDRVLARLVEAVA